MKFERIVKKTYSNNTVKYFPQFGFWVFWINYGLSEYGDVVFSTLEEAKNFLYGSTLVKSEIVY